MNQARTHEHEPRATPEQLRRYLGGLSLREPSASFGQYLTDRLAAYSEGRGFGAEGYVIAVTYAADECEQGKSTIPGRALPDPLRGLRSRQYSALCDQGMDWGEGAFGAAFAAKVMEYRKRTR